MKHIPFPRVAASVAVAAALCIAVPMEAVATDAKLHPTVAKTSTSKTIGKGTHADRVEARISELRGKLKITPDQEDKWNNLTQVMRDNAQKLDTLTQARMQNNTKMTAVDDLNSYSQIADAHADGVKKFVPAFQALYDSMSEPQKKQADALFQPGNGSSRMASGKSRS